RVEEPGPDDLFTVGVIAEVKQILKLPEGQIRILVEGLGRVRLTEFPELEPYCRVVACPLSEPADPMDAGMLALMRTASRLLDRYVKGGKALTADLAASILSIEDPGRFADTIASHLPIQVSEKQQVLELVSPRERLEALCTILARELEIVELEKRIETR